VAGSVRAGVLGWDYQHRQFWIEACRLFVESAVVQRVALEKIELRAFDDVVTAYREPIWDAHNRLIDGDHHQLKFHVSYEREIRGLDLASPKFTNARRVSLLERLAQATAGGEIPRRMTLITPHAIDNSDPLRLLVSPRDGEIILAPLFVADATLAMKQLREGWREAVGNPDDDRLRAILKHLRIRQNVSMDALDAKLGYGLDRAGLAPVMPTSLQHPYVSLAEAFIKGRTLEHDRDQLEAILRKEKLWIDRPVPEPNRPKQIGIKSFSPFAYELEDEALVLNLLWAFHGRYTVADVEWDRDLFPRMREFLVAQVRSGQRYELHLDTHLSIAFAAGYVLDKADAEITPIQRLPNGGRIVWPASGGTVDGPLWEEPRTIDIGAGPATALAIAVTHPVEDDVAIYAKRALPDVGRVIVMTVAGGPSRTSVRDGAHAHALAARLSTEIQAIRRAAERARPVHVFAAAPGALMFLIGRGSAPWGPTITYEYDFDRRAPGAYEPAFHLPPDAVLETS
jgi:hypothetical protein